ncbi:MAG: DUF4440 domain-containing protein [Ferruginibacter sp.]
MNKKLFLFFSLVFTFLISIAQQKDEMIIRNSLHDQTKAWNAGDINSFMATYWQSDSLMFIGKTGITYGWEKTKQNYIKSYPDTTTMGKLDFEILQIKRLSVLYFSVVGKWHLTRSIGDLNGHFTLLYKKIKGRWVIVSDHSS